jgi:hypothetical protein
MSTKLQEQLKAALRIIEQGHCGGVTCRTGCPIGITRCHGFPWSGRHEAAKDWIKEKFFEMQAGGSLADNLIKDTDCVRLRYTERGWINDPVDKVKGNKEHRMVHNAHLIHLAKGRCTLPFCYMCPLFGKCSSDKDKALSIASDYLDNYVAGWGFESRRFYFDRTDAGLYEVLDVQGDSAPVVSLCSQKEAGDMCRYLEGLTGDK